MLRNSYSFYLNIINIVILDICVRCYTTHVVEMLYQSFLFIFQIKCFQRRYICLRNFSTCKKFKEVSESCSEVILM